MKKKIQALLFTLALQVIEKTLMNREIGTPLTAEYLIKKGWRRVHGTDCYFEPNVKERDKVWIEFEHHYYRVWHGANKTFVALRSSKEWFELYYKILFF